MAVDRRGELTAKRVMRVAAFREAMRDFESRTETALRAWGLTPQRYLLLVFVKGATDGSQRPTMSELRRRLKLSANTVTDLVTRAEEAGLVTRQTAEHDQRFVYVTLTPAGNRALAGALRETEQYRRELASSFETLATTFRAANRR